MQTRKAKIIMILVVFLFLFFFSNDFGLIDVEKTSIITAVAIDKDGETFNVTAQIAVPEATDTNAENQKAQLSGSGTTVGAALKDLGDVSGWFPKLAFCNLILIGNSISSDNVIPALDYFAKTLRVQDSAIVALAENSAKELLEAATPLDNISSFALQKIMLKNTGFDRDIASSDVKTFCADHYSLSRSSYMPLIKIISTNDSQSGGGGGSSSETGMQTGSSSSSESKEKRDKLFNARTTALFVDGIKVGELDQNLTLVFNATKSQMSGTTLSVRAFDSSSQKETDYLLTVLSSKPSLTVKATEKDLLLNVALKLYCKISDHAANNSDQALSQNKPLPKEVVSATEKMLTEFLNDMIETSIKTGCDFLKIKEKLYRYNFKQYSRYKDNYLSVMKSNVTVSVFGQV